MTAVRIDEFTDPGCPWAWSAEPFRRRIDWLYGDHLEWRLHLVGLSASPDDYARKGLTAEMLATGARKIAAEHHMPIFAEERPLAATLPACRAIVAAREHGGETAARRLLHEIRLRYFGGAALDDPATLAAAADGAGIGADQLEAWTSDPVTEQALADDMRAARHPSPAALALGHKLAAWEEGLRYTCPSWEVVRSGDGLRLSAPGFQPLAVYEALLANLLPDVPRRPDPESVLEALEWAGEPLATQEVAVLCNLSLAEAREQLAEVAGETAVGSDAVWRVSRYRRESSTDSSERASGATASASASSSTP
jgi:predicted DsbA family dithiol-disulfide isomerase